jgi:hypothetical protein
MFDSAKRQWWQWDAYPFRGSRPQSTVRGVFGEPKARVTGLVRDDACGGCGRARRAGYSPDSLSDRLAAIV